MDDKEESQSLWRASQDSADMEPTSSIRLVSSQQTQHQRHESNRF